MLPAVDWRSSLIELPKDVKLVRLTEKKIEELYGTLARYSSIWEDHARDFKSFRDKVLSFDTYMFEVGKDILVMVDGLVPKIRCRVHVCWFSHKSFEKTETLKDLLLWAFFQWELMRVEALVPRDSGALERILSKKFGFRYEGTLRQWTRFDGVPADMTMYSILRGEVL